MRKILFLSCIALGSVFCCAALSLAAPGDAVPTAEPFSGKVLVEGLENPWEVVYGPDNQLWVTERTGKRVTQVNPKTGAKKTLLTIDETITGPQQGVLGLALEPGFLSAPDKNRVYVVHTYQEGSTPYMKIMSYQYDPAARTLGQGQVVMEKLPAGDDHNAGRLIFGPDGKLYYSHGEQGHNQGANYCLPIEAQRLPTQEELAASDWSSYLGKILRLEVDGSIPRDNPVINGVKSHIYTYGHRNPQGLVAVKERIYSCEHGPSTDDEINLLVAGGNYGWPHVAGFRDDQAYVYANYSAAPNCHELTFDANVIPAGVPTQKETDWKGDFVEPLKTLNTVPNGYDFSDARCKDVPYMCWPTVAPSSIAYYPPEGPIPGWGNSLIISTLKNGALYRMKLSEDGRFVQGDTVKLFRTDNRYRVVTFAPDLKTIFVATDSGGNFVDGNAKPSTRPANPGSILVFTYNGK